MRFAPLLELDAEQLKDIFNVDFLCYLTYEVGEIEQFKMDSIQLATADFKHYLLSLQFGAKAISQYLQTLDAYYRLGSGAGDGQSQERNVITQVLSHLPAMHDLRQLFLLQLRQFNPNIQNREYLRDIITANHVLLVNLERASQLSSCSFDLRQHLKQFCSQAIISQYGIALEDFKTNGQFVNDSIFTILHHVGTDLGRADLLCNPVILRPFSNIWKGQFHVILLIFCLNVDWLYL